MNINEINAAIGRISKRAIEIEKEINNAISQEKDHDLCDNLISQLMQKRKEQCEEKVGRVSVAASLAGNTLRHHVRISYKIDGKRASKAKVEEMLAQ